MRMFLRCVPSELLNDFMNSFLKRIFGVLWDGGPLFEAQVYFCQFFFFFTIHRAFVSISITSTTHVKAEGLSRRCSVWERIWTKSRDWGQRSSLTLWWMKWLNTRLDDMAIWLDLTLLMMGSSYWCSQHSKKRKSLFRGSTAKRASLDVTPVKGCVEPPRSSITSTGPTSSILTSASGGQRHNRLIVVCLVSCVLGLFCEINNIHIFFVFECAKAGWLNPFLWTELSDWTWV